nr:MAG: hypothetical protein DIU58_01115 [Sphaerobacter thermophilus]
MRTESLLETPLSREHLRVTLVDHTADPRVASFVESHPDGLPFHHPAWLQTLVDTFGYRAVALACEDDQGILCGFLPLVYRHGWLRGKALWSLPHTPLAGPLATSDAAATALVQAAVEFTEHEVGQHLHFKTLCPDLDQRVPSLQRCEWYPTYMIPLPNRTDPLRIGAPGYQSDIRRGVKKAKEYGLRAREGKSIDDLRAWYRLYLAGMRRKMSPPNPFRFFDAAWHHLHPKGFLRLILIEQQSGGSSELVGGAITLMVSETAVGEGIGQRDRTSTLHLHDLLYWESLHIAWEAGCRAFDLGNVPTGQEGLVRYKRKWGGQPHPVYRYFYPAGRQHARLTSPASLQRRLTRLGHAGWQHVPLAATEWIGSMVTHYL